MQDFIAVVYAIMFFLIIPAIILYVLSSIALYRLAANKGISSPFLAWIPYGRDYLLGKIIDEKVLFFSPVIPYAQWILLIGPVAISILSFAQPIGIVCAVVFALYAYCAHYRLFKLYRPNSAMLYIILSVIFPFLLPIFMFVIRNDKPEEYLPDDASAKGQKAAPQSDAQSDADIIENQTVDTNTAPNATQTDINTTLSSAPVNPYKDVADDLNIGNSNINTPTEYIESISDPEIKIPSHNTPNEDIAKMAEPEIKINPDDPFDGVKASKSNDPFKDDYKNVPQAPNIDDAVKKDNH